MKLSSSRPPGHIAGLKHDGTLFVVFSEEGEWWERYNLFRGLQWPCIDEPDDEMPPSSDLEHWAT